MSTDEDRAVSVQKTFRLKHELYLIAAFSLVLALVITVGGQGWLHYLRIALGLPFILFFPGYVLITALFPKKDDLDGIERVALSFGLSIAVAPLIGLGLNYTPWGIRFTPILVSLIIFIIAMSGIALYRRRKLPGDEQYYPVFSVSLPAWGEISDLDRVLSVFLVLAILFAVGSICYVVAAPKVGEKFTEFYILGMNGKAEGYPRDLSVGEQGEIIVGVVNHEYREVNYYVQIKMGEFVLPRKGPITLAHEKKWESPTTFPCLHPHNNVKVEFLLFRDGDTKPYRSLHLWVNVHEAETE